MRANASTTLLGRAALLVPYSPGHVELYHSWMEDQELREATASERLTLQEEREMQRSWAEDDASALHFFPFSPPPLFFFLLSLSLSLSVLAGRSSQGTNEIKNTKIKKTELTFIVCDATRPGRPPVGDVNLFFRERSPSPSSPGRRKSGESASDEQNGSGGGSAKGGEGTQGAPSSSSPYLHETAEVEVMIADARSRGKGIAKEAVLLCLWWASVGAYAAAEGAAADAAAEADPVAAAAERAAAAASPPSTSGPDAAAVFSAATVTPRLRLARAKIGRRNAASLALFGSSLGFAKTGGSDFFEEDHLELELFVAAAARGEEEKGENSRETRLTLCPQLARVGEYAVVGEVERGEDSAAGVVAS